MSNAKAPIPLAKKASLLGEKYPSLVRSTGPDPWIITTTGEDVSESGRWSDPTEVRFLHVNASVSVVIATSRYMREASPRVEEVVVRKFTETEVREVWERRQFGGEAWRVRSP